MRRPRLPRTIAAITALALFDLAAPPAARAGSITYELDPNHSEVSFQIRHLVSRVRGVFREFDATIVRNDADPAASSVEFRIQAASVDTGIDRRDDHLRSADFFDVAQYPEIVFRSTGIERVSDSEYRVTGGLTIRGRTKVLTLSVVDEGEMEAPGGRVAAGFSTGTTLDRREFGIEWNRVLSQGGAVLGNDVAVTIFLSLRRVVPEPSAAPASEPAPEPPPAP